MESKVSSIRFCVSTTEVLFLDAQNWALLIKLPKFSRSKLALQVPGCKIQDHSFMPKTDGTDIFLSLVSGLFDDLSITTISPYQIENVVDYAKVCTKSNSGGWKCNYGWSAT